MSESFWRLNIKVDCRILNFSACFTEHIAKGVNEKEMSDYKTHREEIIFHVLASFLTFPSARDAMKLINCNCDNVKTQVASDGVPCPASEMPTPCLYSGRKVAGIGHQDMGFLSMLHFVGVGSDQDRP